MLSEKEYRKKHFKPCAQDKKAWDAKKRERDFIIHKVVPKNVQKEHKVIS